jgi:hypothetical protein
MDPIMFGGVVLAFVLSVGLVAAVTRGPHGPGHMRVVGAVFLLAIAAFCVFGFLATFEPPVSAPVRVIYAALGVTSLAGAAWLVRSRSAYMCSTQTSRFSRRAARAS